MKVAVMVCLDESSSPGRLFGGVWTRLPGVMREVIEGGGARSAGKRAAPSLTMVSAGWKGTKRGEAGPAVMTRSSRLRVRWGSRARRDRRSGSLGSSGPRSRAARAEGCGASAPPLLRPADRLAWWDGVSHVVTRPLCLDHLNAVGPLKFRWTTVFREPGGPTELKWSKQEGAAMNPPAAPREFATILRDAPRDAPPPPHHRPPNNLRGSEAGFGVVRCGLLRGRTPGRGFSGEPLGVVARAAGSGVSGRRCRAQYAVRGTVGAALHIRPGPARGRSAESCGNTPALNAVEILPCAERLPLHMGARPLKTDVLGRTAKSRGNLSIGPQGRRPSMCNTPTRTGKKILRHALCVVLEQHH
mgnify:FL=1